MVSQVETRTSFARPDTAQRSAPRRQALLSVAGIVGALASWSCCVVPLVLFGLGVSGAWLSILTRLAPYQPYFMAAAMACVGYGYWLHRHSRKVECAGGQVCVQPFPNRFVTVGLTLATALVIVALAFDFAAPLVLR